MSTNLSYAEAIEIAEESERHANGPGPSELKPAIIIPSFWSKEARSTSVEKQKVMLFSHPTMIDEQNPPLAATLESLRNTKDVGRIIIAVGVTERSILTRADARVREITQNYPDLDILVIGEAERGSISRRLDQLGMSGMMDALEINSYGAVRNLGLLAATVLGSDSVIFIDDDEIINDPDFIQNGLFGLGLKVHDGPTIYAKTGYYINSNNEWEVAETTRHFANAFWKPGVAYNKALSASLKPPRLQQARFACGGILAIHSNMYSKIAFDPWITRGEDVDYLINIKLHGGEMYIDDQWRIINNPPSDPTPGARFRTEVYQFIYEHRKLEFAKSQVDLNRITAESLNPFPGEFIDGSVGAKARITGLLHTLVGPERGYYFRTAVKSVGEANEYARENCANYFSFQRAWSHLTERLWEDVALKSLFTGERAIDRTALTGEFLPV